MTCRDVLMQTFDQHLWLTIVIILKFRCDEDIHQTFVWTKLNCNSFHKNKSLSILEIIYGVFSELPQ